ncbi:hypothetical protein E4U17_002623 [Claviceps sp. LM77 group G4]|nr:hypothetical protein E4U17_002623 [Claviceps sp. LM77 group G4]KAG6076231.1 hypothetical protein E4U16_002892 [Claviceps sp. LM84 group G4]KAG6080822.1 hypothetical protein E4U33_007278 [Claviceps sp. LM78 group G4]
MQKLLKRAQQAQRRARRQLDVKNEGEEVGNRLRTRHSLREAVEEARQNVLDARKARKEDWELGPIAPKRDLGFNSYGIASSSIRLDWSNDGRARVRPEILEKRCAWAGEPAKLNLAPGDRVVLLDGPDRGKIDRIEEINESTGTVLLEKRHRVLSQSMLDQPPQSKAVPISLSAVRLVYPIPDPATGVVRDTIINQLKHVRANMKSPNMTYERWEYGKKWDRVALGLNMVIPWPKTEPPEVHTTEADTIRTEVEHRTFYHRLLTPPMPEVVIDELRNKYSRFRTRHEPWYIEKISRYEANSKHGQKDALRDMQTPLEELREKQRELKASKGEPVLSEDMLEKIGQLMAKKEGQASSQAGASAVTAKSTS